MLKCGVFSLKCGEAFVQKLLIILSRELDMNFHPDKILIYYYVREVMNKFFCLLAFCALFLSVYGCHSDYQSHSNDYDNINETPPSGDGLNLTGIWALTLHSGYPAETLELKSDGTFTSKYLSNTATGFWTSSDGIILRMQYSVTSEVPPTGTKMNGRYDEDSGAINGVYDYIPSFVAITSSTWQAVKK